MSLTSQENVSVFHYARDAENVRVKNYPPDRKGRKSGSSCIIVWFWLHFFIFWIL